MAEQTTPVLPPIPSPTASQQALGQIQVPNPMAGAALAGPTSKDLVIGAGALLVLAILFFFIRLSFVKHLVGKSMKRSPNSAGLAGWGLYGGLFFGSAIGCAALASKTLLTIPLVAALAVLSLVCFGIMFAAAAAKN